MTDYEMPDDRSDLPSTSLIAGKPVDFRAPDIEKITPPGQKCVYIISLNN